jgi:hypothetical protein
VFGDLIEFEPGGEVSAFRTKHATTDVGIVLHCRERPPQLRKHLHTKAVQLFGPIDNDQEDVTAFFRRDAAVVRN